MQTITKTKIVKLPITNQTDIKIIGSYYIEKEIQNHFKNGKKKGKTEYDHDYYFFDNKEIEESFLSRNQDLKKFDGIINLVLKDAYYAKYNCSFIIKNLNRID